MKKTLLTGMLLAASIGPALAEGFYFGGSLGAAQIDKVENYVQASQAAYSAGGNSSYAEYNDYGGSLKLIAGYALNRHFALEAGLVSFGTQEAEIHVAGLKTENNEWNVGALFVDAVGMLPLTESFSLLGKVGVAQARTRYKYTDTLGGYYKANKSEGLVKFGFGAEYLIAGKYAVRAEFEQYPDVGDLNTAGESDINVVSVGFNYKL